MRFAAARNAERPRLTDGRPLRATLSHNAPRQGFLRPTGDIFVRLRFGGHHFRISALSTFETGANSFGRGPDRDDGSSINFHILHSGWLGPRRMVFPRTAIRANN